MDVATKVVLIILCSSLLMIIFCGLIVPTIIAARKIPDKLDDISYELERIRRKMEDQ
jgi:hypothetical protein